jgi:transformation/transcription domain-associated protein
VGYRPLIHRRIIIVLSFLTYLLKSNADYIQSYEESICKSIVNLLVTCPPDCKSIVNLLVTCSPDSVSIKEARIDLELCKIHVII